jgi:FtsH-binding integral membrane protein
METAVNAKPIAFSIEEERVDFLNKTYFHLAAALVGFMIIETILLNSPLAPLAAQYMTSGYMWLVVLGAFMGVSYIADNWANSATSIKTQYAGLALYVVAEAIIFLPILYIAKVYAPDVIVNAAIMTGVLFAAISIYGLTSKRDFTFLRAALPIGGMIAMGLIVVSIIFGFTLGVLFSGAMIIFAAASILYTTHRVMHEYTTGQHVAASLALFAGVALLFWYIVQILLSFAGDE